MSIKIYGHSDDCVEIDGDIREEFNPASDDEMSYLAFSDGTLLSIKYGEEGLWRINQLQAGSSTYSKVEATDPDGDYSDRVELSGGAIKWVVFGYGFAKAKK